MLFRRLRPNERFYALEIYHTDPCWGKRRCKKMVFKPVGKYLCQEILLASMAAFLFAKFIAQDGICVPDTKGYRNEPRLESFYLNSVSNTLVHC